MRIVNRQNYVKFPPLFYTSYNLRINQKQDTSVNNLHRLLTSVQFRSETIA